MGGNKTIQAPFAVVYQAEISQLDQMHISQGVRGTKPLHNIFEAHNRQTVCHQKAQRHQYQQYPKTAAKLPERKPHHHTHKNHTKEKMRRNNCKEPIEEVAPCSVYSVKQFGVECRQLIHCRNRCC